MRIDTLKVLAVVRELEPFAYGNPIYDRICQQVGPSRWLRIPATWRVNMAHVYTALVHLENKGLVYSIRSVETFPERGNRRRHYYRITDAGQRALEKK